MLKLQGKNVIVGISGGIAVYKVCQVVRSFRKMGANVDVIMTENAARFVTPLTFETLSNNPVTTDMFAEKSHWEVEHVSLAKKADLFVICPATANIVGKIACGIADDMLSTTVMATTAPVVICPAMNVNMYRSAAFQSNLQTLRDRGVHVVGVGSGFLACGDHGEGRMAEPDEIVEYCANLLVPLQDFVGKKVLVTCGATLEKLDDVRFVTNFSSGKMGSAVVTAALKRGAEVTVVLGRHTAIVDDSATVVNVETTQEMFDETLRLAPHHDVIVMAAAPCDYRPERFSSSKIKSASLTVNFIKNPDIAKAVGEIKQDRFLCVFAAETDDNTDNARKKLTEKHADLAVLNDVKHNNVFGSDTNTVTFVTPDGALQSFAEMKKIDVADMILNKVLGK
ncbi:MAG: bifunctional phosphopantothenoylcysteine decarboxylase/phosphopantothenate--cysteine ligase CoaBC [Corallococcus sp.]|nr:bifunctional phosphopantothenoylcysteine decarboxylase/phosphopantothenate--cysteine ligase CoaBC [Corallococcus sp.]MCM1359145.1 bifunctional phosphopantothenoylcysteine decarboxylase/phosphopantothenate--cysteine ligase CoaBC [Corallococcus sp.]MCM1394535.1 bifunctional phosphopantothenoylcysteine decarboxylase/phosphopantothenate--cysteine ligase CoaBC [Corallococcus sp.]